jgi:hypothetical protein
MKYIPYGLILISFFGCLQKHPEKNNSKLTKLDSMAMSNELVNRESDNERFESDAFDKRINLEIVLSQKYNDYLASIDDSILSLCCYEILDIIKSIDYGKFNKKTEAYYFENQKKTVDVYFFEKSFLKEYYNAHHQVMRKDLVCGKIDDNSLLSNSSIKIGMTKTDFFERIFQPNEILKKINRLDIYENELGDAFTSYRFVNNTLKEIVFDSDYDWIDKEFKE